MFSSWRKKTRLFRSWVAGRPIWCAWQVTYRCNFRCKFCGYWNDPLGRQPEPSVDEYKIGAQKLATFGSLLVSLAGGEPLLRKDLPQIVSAISEYHLPFITTNGSLVTQENAAALMAAGLWGVSVSIDYADPKKHDDARNRQGAWQRAWQAVEYFSKARTQEFQRVNVMAVLLDNNIDELETIMKMAAERNAYFMVQPYGYLKTGSHDYECRHSNISSRLLDMWRRNRNFLSNPTYLKKFDAFHNGGIEGCKAGRAFFNIDSTGDIAICVENKHAPIANLYTDSQYKILNALKSASRRNTCKCCWYNCRGEVESLYNFKSLIQSLPTFFFNHGVADGGKMGRWT